MRLTSLLLIVAALSCTGRDPDSDNANTDDDVIGGELTDAEIAGVLRAANFSEIEQANVARPRLTTPVARAFADDMLDEHTNNNIDLQVLIEDEEIGFVESDLSVQLEEDSDVLVADIQNASLQDIDELYLSGQLDMHASVLELITEDLLLEAQNDPLQRFLEDTRDMLEEHIDDAQIALDDVLDDQG